MSTPISGETRVAGVAGWPVRHSLSPVLHNAWIAAAGLDAVYVPFAVAPGRFLSLVEGLRGGSVKGLNVTVPLKEEALAAADVADDAARCAGAANLLLFHAHGAIEARNSDGAGLLWALADQAPGVELASAVVLMVGAGGAARGAAAALLSAGVQELRLVNRTRGRAEAVAEALGGRIRVFDWEERGRALEGAAVIVNATSVGLEGRGVLDLPIERAPAGAVIMDMVYRPLRTGLLQRAEASGRRTVDGLAMLIGQARPSFEALFGAPAPAEVDVRALALGALGEDR